MKVKEFSITRYGPVRETGRFVLGGFNLIWGENEDGKTLTIDALVKLLLGRAAKDFRNIDRVEEKPEGYLVLEDDKGRESKVPDKGDLTKITGLTSSQCCNIFVVRNSDLSISREAEFYTGVTDRLTGLRTEDISKVKKALRDIARITPGNDFRDSGDEKLKTRVKEAGGLLEKVRSLAVRVREEGFDELERESLSLRDRVQATERQLQDLEDARRRERYETGKDALEKLTDGMRQLKSLEVYNENDEQLWRDCEKEIEKYAEQVKGYLHEMQGLQAQFDEVSQKLSQQEREFKVFEDRKRDLEQVNLELKTYEMGISKLKSDEAKGRFYTVSAAVSAVLLVMSILAAAVSQSAVFYGLLALFFGLMVAFAGLRFSFTQKKAHLAAVFERIRLNACRFEFSANTPEELYSSIQRFEEEHRLRYERLEEIRRNKGRLEERIRELQNKQIPAAQQKIREAEGKIQKIKAKSREESLKEYEKRLQFKEQVERQLGQQASVLRSHFGERGKQLEDNILHWTEEVRKLEEYRDKAQGVTYNEASALALRAQKDACQQKLDELTERMEALGEQMAEVEREANAVLKPDEPVHCEMSLHLGMIEDKLAAFIEENESRKAAAIEAIQIFEEIEREEKGKVSELFGVNSAVSRYFNEITDGLYEEVVFDQDAGMIRVKRREGQMLTADKLSGGAYDQLYLSIRLALGEKLLKGSKGFFIMDDPFVKADPNRLQRQIGVLRKISELGWQIIYLSAKGEIRDALKGDVETGRVRCFEVKGTTA